ncbi:hypothetical protein FZEAL_120 [Fusarium zealandicum]|uniref:Uncharacterized protein n=1 Tax=Fusarium zealandicum TaxID=1053134 RepID=A0A8H4XQ51_9HYPO|nr:hypothetical protein FZEAL_120 [Fusarium zealandicum]
MLSRPGFLIRRLITPQRSQPGDRDGDRDRNDDHDYTDSCEELSSCCAKKSTSKKSRAAKSRLPVPKKKPVTATPVTIRRVPSVHHISHPVPPPPAHRSYSNSIVSLRSCEGQNDALDTLTRTPLAHRRAASGLCLAEHGRTHSHSTRSIYTPPSRNGRPSPGNSSRLDRYSPRPSTLSLSDNGADGYVYQPTDSHAAHSYRSSQSTGASSDSVDRLIRETDEAFKAVGSALREARCTLQGSVMLPSPPSPPGIPTFHKYSRSMPLPSSFQRHPRLKEDSSASSSLRSSPDRRASVKKPQRKKNSQGGNRQGKSPIRTPRWTLSENVTDILTGQRFRRIEADEMLTPDRIAALRKKREEAQQLDEERLRHRYSSESARSMASDNSETDVEPFHLDDLASRISARAAVMLTTLAEAEPPSLAPDLDVVHQDFSKQDDAARDDESIKSVQDKEEATTEPYYTPLLPLKNPARFGAEPLRKLSSIPEVMVTTPGNTQLEPSTDRRSLENPDLKTEENDEFLYLKSTPFTLTKPSFRHGPITFSKAEVGKGVKTMDDTLDWTAFQMAILGGAGDLLQDMSSEEDTKQVEEITSWFESFGFETYGVLVPEDVPSMRSSSRSTLSSTPSTIDTDIDLPIPVGAEFPSGFWNAPAPGQALDKAKFFNSTGLKRWVGEKRLKRPSSHSSAESLPPSPMMPLVVHMGDSEDDITDTIPMGYNLGHDLGDFLRWESENVYAPGFCKSP